MFVQSRVGQIARSHNIDVIVSSTATIPAEALESADDFLVLLDLDSSELDPFAAAKNLKLELRDRVTLFGFYPHVKSSLAEQARQIGFDYVVTNRNFVEVLNELLKSLSQERTHR